MLRACSWRRPRLADPPLARKDEIQDFFNEYGHGTITEIKLMDGFGFIQYDSEADAKDVVPGEFTPTRPAPRAAPSLSVIATQRSTERNSRANL